MIKTIRIWNGCKVMSLITIYPDGGSAHSGGAGGAENSTAVDIELDPWAGLIVDHSAKRSPVDFREREL